MLLVIPLDKFRLLSSSPSCARLAPPLANGTGVRRDQRHSLPGVRVSKPHERSNLPIRGPGAFLPLYGASHQPLYSRGSSQVICGLSSYAECPLWVFQQLYQVRGLEVNTVGELQPFSDTRLHFAARNCRRVLELRCTEAFRPFPTHFRRTTCRSTWTAISDPHRICGLTVHFGVYPCWDHGPACSITSGSVPSRLLPGRNHRWKQAFEKEIVPRFNADMDAIFGGLDVLNPSS